jgi:hypothetical protein
MVVVDDSDNNPIQWLDDFNEAISWARSIAASVDRNGEILSLSGNVIMGERLQGLAVSLREAIENADSAISQMISDDVRNSFRRTDETFAALLKSVVQVDHHPPPTTEE